MLKRGMLLCGLVLVVAGCSAQNDGVASLGGTSDFVDGYVNQATADYAACLEQLGLEVVPEADEGAGELTGYAAIEGAAFIPDENGELSDDTSRQPIGVDGTDRDSEIRECYASHADAKDALIDVHDSVIPADAVQAIPGDEIEAGRQWASCARDAGASMIEDPNEDGYVVIPPELELEQAEMLGAACSLPMAENKHWPQFDILAGVIDPESGMSFSDPYAIALDGPFLDSERAEKYRADHPDEFEE